MPWVMEKNEAGEFCLYKQGADGQAEGETLGCHPTEEEAQKQMAALHANMGEEAERVASEPHPQRGRVHFTRAVVAKEQAEAVDDVSAPIWWRASSEGVKRDGLDLKAKDWVLSDWEAYPIVLYGHDYSGRNLPIGLGEAKIVDKELHIGVRYDPDDEFAMKIRSKALKGMIAGSVGWEDIDQDGRKVHNLYEFSMVPLGTDPSALPLRQAAALRSMADAIERIDMDNPQPIGDSQPTEPGELDWQEVAAAMVRCVMPTSDEPEEARLSAYRALLPKYRKLGKVAPEYLDAATISALGPAERRGLFLAGEPDLLPDAFAEPEVPEGADDGRVTAALAEIQARLSALEERPRIAEQRILTGILAKLQAATPEPPAPTRAAGGDDGHEQSVISDKPSQALQAILEKLESLT